MSCVIHVVYYGRVLCVLCVMGEFGAYMVFIIQIKYCCSFLSSPQSRFGSYNLTDVLMP